MKKRSKQNPYKFCHYHGQAGHYTSECEDLLKQLWRLYEDGLLNEFIKRPQKDEMMP